MTEGLINAYLGFSKQQLGINASITTEDVLNRRVKATYDAKPIIDQFPLLIYAPSNSKSAVQNHIMCEYLASNGYCVVSVGSAGDKTLKRYDQQKATLAQVQDMEFIEKYISDSLNLNFPDIGLFGFSTGSMATIIYQMKTPQVKAVASLDGSQEYAFYPILNKIEGFSFDKAKTPYLMIANKYEDFSIFPYYNSIAAEHKYLYKMTAIDHNGFISYWQQFAMCSKDSNENSIADSYTILCDCVNRFFNSKLKPGMENLKDFKIQQNELIHKDSTDYHVFAQLLNQILQEGIDSSITELKSNEIRYKGKAIRLNVVGKMFLGNENDIAIKIFKANTEIHPDSWESFYNLTLAYKESNQKEAAEDAIVKAMDINKDNEDVQKLYDEVMKMKE